ncbi:MAG TPA: DUF5663 domain-containing protein [Candidatus Saccharimonadales bacterium]|jgi:hypothetical protein
MLKLDNNLLDELGLGGLPADQKQAMLQHIYDTLELRVGTRLANQMTDQQLDEFERFIDAGGDANQAQALQWLESNLPNYKDVVNQVFEELKGEVRQMAPQIMSSSVPAAGQQPAVAQPAHAQSQPMVAQPAQYAQPHAVQPQQVQHQQTQSHLPPDITTGPAAYPAAVPQAPSANQPDPASYQSVAQPVQPPQPTSPQPQPTQQGQVTDDAREYQFPTQQPPAGPGGYRDQNAA